MLEKRGVFGKKDGNHCLRPVTLHCYTLESSTVSNTKLPLFMKYKTIFSFTEQTIFSCVCVLVCRGLILHPLETKSQPCAHFIPTVPSSSSEMIKELKPNTPTGFFCSLLVTIVTVTGDRRFFEMPHVTGLMHLISVIDWLFIEVENSKGF